MDCEFCGVRKSEKFVPTDWGERHLCAECAPQVKLTVPQESPVEPEDRFKTAAERFLRDLGVVPRNEKRPPSNPK